MFGPDASELKGDGDVTNVMVATIQEFGTLDGHIPERSFIRAWVDENNAAIRERMRRLAVRVHDGEITQVEAMGLLGAWASAQIVERMRRGLSPGLEESTKARRAAPDPSHTGPRSIKPLIDTSQLVQSIDHEVRR